ncbi:MAG: dimethylargininase [Acidobacteriota bacterium]
MSWIAVTRPVSATLADCELTHLERVPIRVDRARAQHAAYEVLLAGLGCRIERLPAAPEHPDSVFVEDTAVVVDEVAVMTRPGASSRRGEVDSVARMLTRFRTLRALRVPATLDGGDVLRFGRRFYVGLSSRSNTAGVEQLRSALEPFDYSVEGVELQGCLHLKSAITEIAPGMALVNPAWIDVAQFTDVEPIEVDAAEPSAANGLRIGETLVYADAFPRTLERVLARGIEVALVDLSELAKAEGAVTCCSLIFSAAQPQTRL